MADRRLVILASSRRPDVYFNIIALNAKNGISNFIIATIGDDDERASQKLAADLNRNLTVFVAELEASKYTKFPILPSTPDAPLSDPEPMTDFFANVPWGSLTLTFQLLREGDLKTFLRDQHAAGAVFDVTACKNATLAGAVAWIVSRGGSPIHTFEFQRALTFGESDLLPYLGESDFNYRDLSESALIRGATRRINVGTVHKRRFWLLSAAIAVVVALVSFFLPPAFANPVLAGAATFATIMSGVGLIIRNPDV